MSKKKGFKHKIGQLHLWLGLTVGFFVFVISITGALYAFQAEITNYLRKDAIHHHEKNTEKKAVLPLKVLEQKVNKHTKEKHPVHWVNVPVDKKRSYIFYYYEHNPKAWNFFEEYVVYKSVYVNPFTGKVLGVYDETRDFFNIVKSIHYSFLLRSEWGAYACGIPTLIFIFMLISGIILWWPKNKAARKQRFWFNWKNVKTWKRRNYDLHNILGFYASFLALIVAITGLYYSFFFIQAMIYVVFSGGDTSYPNFDHITTKAPIEQRNETTLDKIGKKAEELYPDAYAYSLDFGHPHLDDHEHPNYSVFVQQLSHSYHINHSLIFDENSGELLHVHEHKDKNLGEKVIAANYDTHIGAIFGLPGKILAFTLSLVCASLPITGFLVWWGRNKKKSKIQK
ncbi:PepSY-associated TM helix domain-containing protein [Flavobacterium suncheonense]|uniref:Peptidase n=1 Tax=Flavobacterium suncheonense GH29-5 = DSM 17707 TaxID=1121899 RepID=A0A0A2M8G2_9FLAO|nr:PepSY-associated TM helix domain-containing protein [Flavobacterium suncheonense]KGO87708.1 peptidase [Flavobacterium suncheonense GH29-5 = DSM 17707]